MFSRGGEQKSPEHQGAIIAISLELLMAFVGFIEINHYYYDGMRLFSRIK